MKSFFCQDHVFQAYTVEHYIPLAVIALFGVIIILKSRKLDSVEQKKKNLFLVSMLAFTGSFMIYPLAAYEGDLNIYEDLPLHLCRFLALTSPLVVLKNNRFWIGIFYFWIMVGTLNANLTPDVQYGFPNWTYFSYWLTHGFLMIIPLYYVFVFKIEIGWRDYFNAYWMMNLFLMFTLLINLWLGSNYMYTKEKPPVASLLDMLGPWPIYLISGQLLVLLLFYIVFIPFHLKGLKKFISV